MGFNKRHVTGPGVLAAFKDRGIEGVQRFFTHPDALIVPSQKSLAQDAHNMFDIAWETDEWDDFNKWLQDHSEHYEYLKSKAIALKEINSTDPEISSYITAHIEIIDKAMKYYTL